MENLCVCVCWFFWLVVDLPILKNMSSSMGIIIPKYYGKIEHVPNHQPVFEWFINVL